MNKGKKTVKKSKESSSDDNKIRQISPLKEYDIIGQRVVTPMETHQPSATTSITYLDHIIVGYEDGTVKIWKWLLNDSKQQWTSVDIAAPAEKSHHAVTGHNHSKSVNYLHVDKLKKWLFVNYNSLGLYVYEFPSDTNKEVKLISHNILHTVHYFAIAIDELYKNERLAIVTTQALFVYSYKKPSATDMKPNFRTGRIELATKQRSVHMSLTHISEESLNVTYLRFIGNYVIIGQPLTSMSYTCIELDSVVKGTHLSQKKKNNAEFKIEDLTKSGVDASPAETSNTSTTVSGGGGGGGKKSSSSSSSGSSSAVVDTIIPTSWPLFGKLEANQLPEVFRVHGKMILLRAGRNRYVPGDLSGLCLTRQELEKNPEVSSTMDKILKKYLQNDSITGVNNRFILDEFIFENVPNAFCLNHVWLTGVTVVEGGSSIILESLSIVEPVLLGGKHGEEDGSESQQQQQLVENRLRVQLSLNNSSKLTSCHLLPIGNNGDMVLVSQGGDLYYIQAKF